ncbi:RidA family protein [Enteractinococcus coprophilus]|uniref:Enamine deaminase RidA (YjgF/YER057c/UK114 family) n=1 Tax=Enteractinococcus coprophilus TaxID=1027633 RepID=A0A543AM82_9MICC|nr:RidA family protein [Enteractinococcus coprophilus]TQL73661.1 enamine deaminase RidA (YjgF/YER057c/UK114 family) [Enteractinococcus coprophilus]
MSAIEQRIEEAGYTLPAVGKPLAAYVPTMRDGDNIYTSGQLPMVDGKPAGTGKVGQNVSVEDAADYARICVLNALAAIKTEIGDLDKITQVTKVVGFVSSASDFDQQHIVINGASEFLAEIFQEKGQHARSAVGVAMLPMNVPVEVEMIVKVQD